MNNALLLTPVDQSFPSEQGRFILEIVIRCVRGWQPAHLGAIPGQVSHPRYVFLIEWV